MFIIFSYSVYAASSTPTLVTKINSAFTKIQGYLEKIATPIAGVCIASGFLIRKLSLGDEPCYGCCLWIEGNCSCA